MAKEFEMIKSLFDLTGKFHECECQILQNKDGFYKIRIKEYGYWRDITHNDTVMAIIGKGNPETHVFYNEKLLQEFLDKYFLSKPPQIEEEKELKIDNNWEIIEEKP